MTDILFPPDLVPSAANFSIDDFTAADASATSGAIQTSALYGSRRWRLRMDFAGLSGARLARFEAVIASLRGRANRVWIAPPMADLRGAVVAPELLTNNRFTNGVAGWAAYSGGVAITATDNVGRVRITDPSVVTLGIQQTVSNAGYAPLVARAIVSVDRSVGAPQPGIIQSRATDGSGIWTSDSGDGMLIAVQPGLSTGQFLLYVQAIAAGQFIANDFFSTPFTSFSQCALTDAQPNTALYSDILSNAAWVKTTATVADNATAAPDLSVTADSLVLTASTAVFKVAQSFTVPAAQGDYCATCCIKAASRSWAYLTISDGTSSQTQWFNIGAGTLGSTQAAGTLATNVRGSIVALGNGWYRCYIVMRKGSALTTLTASIGAASGDLNTSFLGTAAAGLYLWRAGFSAGSVPFLPAQTAGVATTGISNTGNALNVKGLQANGVGILLPGDFVEVQDSVNSQLLRVTSRLDSDAAGMGLLQFENPLRYPSGNGNALIMQSPMGRFLLASSNVGVEYAPGIFASASLEFIESQ